MARRCCCSETETTLPTTNHLRNPGYTFTGWATENGGAVVHAPGATIAIGTDDITLYAVWVANTDTPYTIERYQLNADGTITKLPNLTGTGTTGESVTTVPVAPDGYQVPTTHYITGLWDGDPNYVINERLTDIISGDGKMVLVHVFVPVSGNYVVKIYKVDGMGNAIQVDVAGNELAAGDALLEGYKHAGAVGSNVVVDATGASATAGYIYHAYASNPPAGYSYLGDDVSFTVNGQTYLTIASGVIGNQTLELVIYFEPNTYELTYVTGDPTDPDAGKWVGAGDSSPGHAVWL